MKYVLATIDTEPQEAVISGIGAVGVDVWDSMKLAILDLDLLRLQRANHVRINYERYRTLIDDLAARPAEIVQMTSAQRARPQDELEAAFMNLVLSIRLYLEHAEASVIRRYGKESERHTQWRTMLSAYYDSSFPYRFLYRLRNYVAHSSTRGLTAHVNATQVDEKRFALQFEHIAQTSVLLNAWSKWGSLRDEIADHEILDLPTHAAEAVGIVLQIEHGTTLIYGPEITEALRVVHRVRNTVSMYQGPLYLIGTADDYGLENMSVLPVPSMPPNPDSYVPAEYPKFRSPRVRFQMDESTHHIRDGNVEYVTKQLVAYDGSEAPESDQATSAVAGVRNEPNAQSSGHAG